MSIGRSFDSNTSTLVISDDVSDPQALKELLCVLKEAHDVEAVGDNVVHRGQRAMEKALQAKYYVRRSRALVEWYRRCCKGCQEKVHSNYKCLLGVNVVSTDCSNKNATRPNAQYHSIFSN